MSARPRATEPPGVLLTGEEAGAADHRAVAEGDTWDGLMARAGGALARGVVTELRARAGGVHGRRALLVAGKGDNGGDAWVAAARLRDRGVQCTVLAVHGTDVTMSDHSGRARAVWLATGGRAISGTDDRDAIDAAVAAADVRVDAVLGTGISGAPRDEARVGVLICNDGGRPVVACDIPSGVDAATGATPGVAVQAVRTVTFGAAKRGLVLHPGAAHAGVVDVAGLGPRWQAGSHWVATRDSMASLAPLASGDDKHARGRVLVVAGSRRYAGAAALSAAATVRAGAGLVTLATTAPRDPVLALEPGVMVVRLPALDEDRDDGAGGPSPDAVEQVRRLAADADAVVIGPGCGHGPGTRAIADALVGTDLPLVLDADALNVFRDDAEALRRPHPDPAPLVLTPHHRELGRLTGTDGEDALARRHQLVPDLADDLDALVVGKGPGTVVADPWSGEVAVATAGGPALGSGGTGDVLAGMLGAAIAAAWRGGDRPGVGRAVVAQVHRHGMLGDRAGVRAGGRATARDLLGELPRLWADLLRPGPA